MGRRRKEIIEEYEEYEDNSFFDDMKKEIIGIIIIAIAVLLGISVFYGADSETLLGPINAGLKYMFGWFELLFPAFVIVYALAVLKDPDRKYDFKFLFSCVLTLMIIGAYPALAVIEDIDVAISFGGVLGMALAYGLNNLGGVFGGYVLLVALSALAFILLTRSSFIGLVKRGARNAKEGMRITKESFENHFYRDEDDDYGYEVERPYPVVDNRTTKNYDIRLDEEQLEDDDYEEDEELEDSEDYDEEDYEEYDGEETAEEDDEYEEVEEDEIDEVKPLSHEKQSFFERMKNKFKSNSKKGKVDNGGIVEILGVEEQPEEVAILTASKNEGIIDIGFWENNEEYKRMLEEKEYEDIHEEFEEGELEEYDEEEYEDDDDSCDEEYDEEYDDEESAEDEEYESEELEEEKEDSDGEKEIDLGIYGKTKISKDVDVLANTPKMKLIATTDNEKDSGGNYTQNIIKKDPHRQKREIKLIDEDGTQEVIEIEEEPIEYIYPKLSLLTKPPVKKGGNAKKELREKSQILEQTLQSFKVNARVTGVTKGPAVTRFELELATGVKVSTIQNLADDIALHMASSGVRIAPVPGKAAIGIEIANTESSAVYMREVLDTEEFRNAKSKIAVCLGKGIDGKTMLMDIAKMPHILIAGATGSGKSVCINTIITSIIYKASPDEVKLIMVDPKVVELKMYAGIPHLLIPVVTEPKKAASALNRAVAEMLERYRLFADNNVKNLQGYNDLMEKKNKRKMPQIVIIVDELADLMMAAGKEVEDAICRLAQMARAAGMHLIIATQRPSVDVITGLIKANIPSRIAFAVSSATDSRTILDSGGAEKLLGKGDMLYFPVGANKPTRIQGAFVSESEVENIVEFIKNNHPETKYNNDVIEKINNAVETKDAEKNPQKEDENDE